MLIYFFILFLLGLCFGSFSTVLISRWQSGKSGIMTGRSECPQCSHILGARELIPFFSWMIQRGKCYNCQSPVSIFYPLAELFMGFLFAWSGWIALRFGYTYSDMMWWIFLFWTFVTGVYLLYDMRYMEIPDQILVPAIIVTLVFLLLGYIDGGSIYLFDFYSYTTYHTFLTDHISSAIYVYSFFFLQILIPGTIFLLREQNYRILGQLFLSYFTFPYTVIIDLLRGAPTIERGVEIPTWIGGGDLRIALFIGLTLGGIHTLSTVMIAYIVGSVVGILLILIAKLSGKNISHEVPFGPFLAIGWIISLSFYQEILYYVQIIYT